MATQTNPTDSADAQIDEADAPEEQSIEVIEDEAEPPETPTAPAAVSTSAVSTAAPAASAPAAAPVSLATAPPSSPEPSNLATLTAAQREATAEIAEIAAQAGRLGVTIDAAKALREGTVPEALRKLVLTRAAAAADARDIIAAPPSPVLPKSTESPIVAAARRAASGAKL